MSTFYFYLSNFIEEYTKKISELVLLKYFITVLLFKSSTRLYHCVLSSMSNTRCFVHLCDKCDNIVPYFIL